MPHFDRRPRSLVLLLALAPLLAGCPDRTKPARTVAKVEQDDPLAVVRDQLRRETTLEGCKTAVAQLNVHLARPGDAKPPALTPTERELLTQQLRLSEDELKEVAHDEFTPLDAHHLASCFLLHDAVRALRLNFADTSEAGQLERARLVFAWAMRQVWRREEPGRTLPPDYTLRMGFSALAGRTEVALAALRQGGADVARVGAGKDKNLSAWAVGVPIGPEVYLFSPGTGQPVAGPGGKGVATLRQVRADPELARAALAEAGATDPKAAVAAAKIWLSPPLSSLSPRARWLQELLHASPPAALGVDLPAVAGRFEKAGEKVEFWNPPGDANSPVRQLTAFLPPEEGGTERGAPGTRFFDLFRRRLAPLAVFPPALAATLREGDPLRRLTLLFSLRFMDLALEPGRPRDLLLRGRFDEASRTLVDQLAQVGIIQRRVASETDLEGQAVAWAEEFRAAYSRFLTIRDRKQDGDLAAAQAQVDALNRNAERVTLLVERAVAEPFAAAVTFQLALCKHEQAERQSRDRSATAADRHNAWQGASAWWTNFLSRFGAAAATWMPPAQLDHARRLLADTQREVAATPASP